MNTTRHFCVICEGKSEVSYLTRLTKFLGEEATAGGMFVPPVAFAGKPPVHGVEGGDCKTVMAAFNRERAKNRKAKFRIWVDADIHIREKVDDPAAFARHVNSILGKTGKAPPFSFSALSFEDFLAMHFDDALYADWKAEFALKKHFSRPLHEKEYIPLFQPFWRRRDGADGLAYEKGSIPENWFSAKSLGNLFRHCDDPEVLAAVRALTPEPTFAEFLRGEITSAFPELWPNP